jgi:hypothetical protein
MGGVEVRFVESFLNKLVERLRKFRRRKLICNKYPTNPALTNPSGGLLYRPNDCTLNCDIEEVEEECFRSKIADYYEAREASRHKWVVYSKLISARQEKWK